MQHESVLHAPAEALDPQRVIVPFGELRKFVVGDPEYAEIRARLEVQLDSLRAHFAVPEEDPVPYVDWSTPTGG